MKNYLRWLVLGLVFQMFFTGLAICEDNNKTKVKNNSTNTKTSNIKNDFISSSVEETKEASKNFKKNSIAIESVKSREDKGRKNIKKEDKKSPTQEEYYSVSNKEYSKEDLDRADALAVKTISSIKDLLKNTTTLPKGKEFELRLRLGELYSERHDYLRDKELADFENAYDRWVENNNKGKEPKLSDKKSKEQLALSVRTFRNLVKNKKFAKEPRMDSALFALGKSLGRLQDDTSIIYFNQLIKDYPKSKLVPETYLSMGDFYFEKNKMDKALDSYKKIMSYKKHRIYPYAVYKMGWCYFNLKYNSEQEYRDNLKKSVSSFKLVISLADRDSNQAGRIDLTSEAIKDLVVVWAELEETKEAFAYFKKIKKVDSYYSLLERLAQIYQDQGKYSKAIELYTKLENKKDLRKTDAENSIQLVNLYDLTGKIESVMKQFRKYSDNYYKSDSAWRKEFATDKVVRKATDDYEYNLRRYATTYHQRYQKTKTAMYSRAAISLYNLYLTDFETNENAYTTRFYLAELYYDTKNYQNAAIQYITVANVENNTKYKKEAALNSVLSYNILDSQQKYQKLPPLAQVKTPIVIPGIKLSLINEIDKFVKWYPTDKKGYPMRFTAANIYFVYGHYDEALSRFYKIIEEIPKTKQADISIKIIASYYNEKKDWDSLNEFSRNMKNNENINKKELSNYLTYNIKLSLYSGALSLEKEGKYKEAADKFLSYQSEFKTDKNADRALYNAGLCYYKLALVDEAIATDERLLSTYPKTAVKADVMVHLAQVYESLARFSEAAKMYEGVYIEFPKDSRALSSLYNSATLYNGLKRYGKSEQLFSTFYSKTKNSSMKEDALWQIALLQEKQNKMDSSYKSYYTLSTLSKDTDSRLYAEAKYSSIILHHDGIKGDKKHIYALKAKLLKNDKIEAYEARNLVAKELFQIAESSYKDFSSYKITNIDKIEEQVASKQAKLVKAANLYDEVIKIGSTEYVVASCYMLGQMNEDFYVSLNTIKFPDKYSSVEITKITSELEKVSVPLKEESLKFFDLAYEKSQNIEVFTEWTRKVYDKISSIDPDKYLPVEEIYLDPLYLSHRVDLNSDTKRLSKSGLIF